MVKEIITTQRHEFVRSINPDLLSKLKEEPLYINHLSDDIKNGTVFPAFRNNRIDFYHKGSKLFSYDGTFKTHHKFASVIKKKIRNDYIRECDLENAEIITNFSDGYTRIKENAKIYAGKESSFVSDIYHSSSYASTIDVDNKNDVVVLDIEASFDGSQPGDDTRNKQDRIDIILLNKHNKTVYFVEAKHYSNNEIWSSVGSKPKVIQQLKRYDNQLNDRKNGILSAYKNFANAANDLFSCSIPEPKQIDTKIILLIFGFDARQQNRLSENLVKNGSLSGIKYRLIGRPQNATQILTNVRTGK